MAEEILHQVRVSEVGEFISHNSCERRFKLEYGNRALVRRLPFAERLFSSLDPVLQEAGKVREAEWERYLRDAQGFTDLSRYDERPVEAKFTPWAEFIESIAQLQPEQEAYAREVQIQGSLGAFAVDGRIDFVVIGWQDGQPTIRLVECKASRRDKTYHRIQVGIYRQIFLNNLAVDPLVISGVPLNQECVEAVVARIDESTNEGQAILELDPIDFSDIAHDIDRLFSSAGPLNRIIASDLDDLPYRLEPKCDGCVFNVDCFSESARLEKMELLGIPPSDIRVVQGQGINSIREFAQIDPDSAVARGLRGNEGFGGNLELLIASARSRVTTLPGGIPDPDAYEVQGLPDRWQSQLPVHEIQGERLIRVYLSVDYDYTENRIGALSAHITDSGGALVTAFQDTGNGYTPDPVVVEETEGGATRELRGIDIVKYKQQRWSGLLEADNDDERDLIQAFITDTIEALARISATGFSPIHFYVWSRSEISHLVEGCTRCGGQTLAHLKELLGCRENLEQLIFSSLGEEVNNRFALGWTGRGLSVVASLRWFGQRFHWVRQINGMAVNLEQVFTQDIFDFKTDLYTLNGEWTDDQERGERHKYEIRSRFFDSLPAAYWHAVWRTLPAANTPNLPHNLARAIERYNRASEPVRLREYLKARVQCLRWIDEKIRFKNPDIDKPLIDIARLAQFELGVDNVSRAALDFLRLEQHIKVANWVSMNLIAPSTRVVSGQTIPISNVRVIDNDLCEAQINLERFDIDLGELESRTTISEGSFVRAIPCDADPNRPQTIGQMFRGASTGIIESIDWVNGVVRFSTMFLRGDSYRLASVSRRPGDPIFEFGTLDESPSEFVAFRVDNRLSNILDSHVYRYFDPIAPNIPEQIELHEDHKDALVRFIDDVQLPGGWNFIEDQSRAVVEGLSSTVQLLQGPPGTGKTQTTAASILTRAVNEFDVGDIVFVVANTHTAVDNLLTRIAQIEGVTREAALRHGMQLPPLTLAKMFTSEVQEELDAPIQNWTANACVAQVNRAVRDSVLVIGGTTGALLKMQLTASRSQSWPNGISCKLLVVDEASMMVFPHFLSLATLVTEDAKMLLAGDNRQLAPILAHDWDKEDRPPVLLYQPYVSAYDVVNNLYDRVEINERSVMRSRLEYTFRLPPIVRSLIGRLYRRDQIELRGAAEHNVVDLGADGSEWGALWGGNGLFLVVHDERSSRKHNQVEIEIISQIINGAIELQNDSVAVITPHRAQRTALKRALEGERDAISTIDTVERLQGGQKATIIISATASDPTAISANVEFILDLNRSNVAFSRVQERLIVVCSESLLDHIAPELEQYESAMLWKSLRALCDTEIISEQIQGSNVRVFTPGGDAIAQV